MVPQKALLVRQRERTARRDDRRVRRQEIGRRRIDAADDIAVPRPVAERGEVLAADGEEHAPRLLSQRIRRGPDVRHMDPAVARNLLPGRALHRETGNSRGGGGRDGVGGDRRRKGMGRIHQHVDPVSPEIVREPARAAEPAGPGLQRRGRGRPRHAGERQGPLEPVVPGGQTGQLAGLGRPAEQEELQS